MGADVTTGTPQGGEHTASPEETSPDDLPRRPLTHHLALTVYWLSNTLLWGALLHVGLQVRLQDWFGEARIGYFLGILGFVGGIVATVTQIVAGTLSDRSLHRWGRRRPFIVAGTMLAVGMLLLLGATKSFWPFAGALVLVQLFTNTALGPFTALLPDTVHPREHGKASGFMGVARLMGDTGGLVLAGILLSTRAMPEASAATTTAFHDRRMLLMCGGMAAFMLVTMAYTCIAIRERPLKRRPEASAWEIAVGSFAVEVKGNESFFWLSLSRAVTNLGFYMFLEILPMYVRYTQGNADPGGTTMRIMLPAIAAAVLSSIPSGMVSDRVGRRPLIFAAQFLMAAGAGAFLLAPNLTVALIGGIPAGLAYGVFTAVEWALACNLLPAGESARYLGVWNASAVVPQILAFPIAGAVGSGLAKVSRFGPGLGWRIDFGIALVCCLAGAYYLRFVREAPRRPQGIETG